MPVENQNSSRILKRVYHAKNNEELEQAYDEWAPAYEMHVTGFGYKIPAVAAGLFARHVKTVEGPVLDAGAGTGLMGEILQVLGYHGQVGIDLSRGMLEQAEKRHVYDSLRRMVLGERLDFKTDHFAACQSIGVFTAGHAPAEGFNELVRVVRPGGHILFSIRKDIYETKEYKDKIEHLTDEGQWQLVEKSGEFAGLPYEDSTLRYHVFVFQIIKDHPVD